MLNLNRLRQDDARGAGATAARGRIITSALLLLAITLIGNTAMAQCNNPAYTPFSRCGTGNITIGGAGTCKQAYLDRNATSGTITIASGGTLAISDQAAQGGIQLTTTGIDIQSGGALKIGDTTCPIGTTKTTDLVTLKFTGTHPARLRGRNQWAKQQPAQHPQHLPAMPGLRQGHPGRVWRLALHVWLEGRSGQWRYDSHHGLDLPRAAGGAGHLQCGRQGCETGGQRHSN